MAVGQAWRIACEQAPTQRQDPQAWIDHGPTFTGDSKASRISAPMASATSRPRGVSMMRPSVVATRSPPNSSFGSKSSSPAQCGVGKRRSEEHTSLQSPDHLVCRLLLEKKKKKIHTK